MPLAAQVSVRHTHRRLKQFASWLPQRREPLRYRRSPFCTGSQGCKRVRLVLFGGLMATTTQIDPMALLAGMAQQTEKKKGGKDAKPQIAEPAMDAAITQWIEADKEAKKWDGIRTTAEAQILAFAVPARLAECRRMG